MLDTTRYYIRKRSTNINTKVPPINQWRLAGVPWPGYRPIAYTVKARCKNERLKNVKVLTPQETTVSDALVTAVGVINSYGHSNFRIACV